MGLLILASSLLLAAAQPTDSQTQDAASDLPPAATAPAAPALPRTRGRTTSPPNGKKPADPKPNVDPGIQLPPGKLPTKPEAPSEPTRPKADSVKPGQDSVKPVAPAPSDPQKPGVRPL
jgi:hypothetical protein